MARDHLVTISPQQPNRPHTVVEVQTTHNIQSNPQVQCIPGIATVVLGIVLFFMVPIYLSLLVGFFSSIFLSSISVFVVLSIFTFSIFCSSFLFLSHLCQRCIFLFILSMCCSHLLLLFHVCFYFSILVHFVYSHVTVQLFYFCYCLDIEDACFDCYCIIWC